MPGQGQPNLVMFNIFIKVRLITKILDYATDNLVMFNIFIKFRLIMILDYARDNLVMFNIFIKFRLLITCQVMNRNACLYKNKTFCETGLACLHTKESVVSQKI